MSRSVVLVSSGDDRAWFDLLDRHLKTLRDRGRISTWHPDDVRVGAKREAAAEEAFAAASAVVLLVSATFLAYEFAPDTKLHTRVLAAAARGVPVLWIPLSHSAHQDTEVREFSAIWDITRPLDSLPEADIHRALVEICETIVLATNGGLPPPRRAPSTRTGGPPHPMLPSLEQLLCSLFDPDGLRRHLRLDPDGTTIAEDLPEGIAPQDLVRGAVEILAQRGLVDVAFFDRLRAEFPARTRDIRAACGGWISARPKGDDCPPIRVEDGAPRHLIEQLEEAYRRREELIVQGLESAEVDHEILQLRRTLRRGPQLQPGESLFAGRYRLVAAVGSGGFATVWRAYDREARSLVALKVLHGQWAADRSHRERFVRGARTMMRLRHPSIVRVLREPCQDEGFLFYVMELIDGVSLHHAVLGGKLAVADAARVILAICDALAFAHQRGYVHRDVKPSNILLDRGGHAYLSDFDLIRGDDTTGGTRTGAGIGSLYFAAPEALADANRVDARADVYSVGMTLLFAALGRDLRLDDLYDAQMDTLSVPQPIAPLIHRATARHADRRHGSIGEFRAELQSALARWQPDPEAAAAQALERQINEWVYGYTQGAELHQVAVLDPPGRSLVVTTRPWRELGAHAIVHLADMRDPSSSAFTRALSAAVARGLVASEFIPMRTGNTVIISSEPLPIRRILHFFIGEDFRGANPEACRQLVHHLIGRCTQAALMEETRSLIIPAPFDLSEQFSGRTSLQEILAATVRSLRGGDAPDTVFVWLRRDNDTMLGEREQHELAQNVLAHWAIHEAPVDPDPDPGVETAPSVGADENLVSNASDDSQMDDVNPLAATYIGQEAGPAKKQQKESCLVVIYGAEVGRKYHIDSREITIGRGTMNDICVPQDSVSRTHATLRVEDDGVSIRDNESSNGTYVNDHKIHWIWLKDGDLIKIGRAIFKFLSGDDLEGLYREEIYRLSIVDGLTQIFNKRYFLETLERDLARARRYNRPLAVVMFDIGHFKQCNDTFGHRAGDFVLREVAAVVRDRIRKVDVLARYGGEEFAMILPEVDLRGATAFAEKIRAMIAESKFMFEGRSISITISLGVAELTPEMTTHDDLIERARKLLHPVEQTGGDPDAAPEG